MLGFLFVEDAASTIDPACGEGADDDAAGGGGSAKALARRRLVGHPRRSRRLCGSLVEDLGLKPTNAFGLVRVAISGRRVSPPLFESLELLGRDRSLARLSSAQEA